MAPRLQQLNARARFFPVTTSLTEPGAAETVALPIKPPKNLLARIAEMLGANATGMIKIANNAVEMR
jgi:hypothetical protein